jgi:cbb3-type cytochrome oxidase cytochrome c subunit
MRAASALLVALALAAGAAHADDAAAAAIQKGRELYVANGCRTCHSAEGKGNPKGVHDGVANLLPAEDIKKWLATPAEMLRKAKNRRKQLSMPAFTHLSAAEQDALVAYLHSLKAPAR